MTQVPRHKVFISYHVDDQPYKDQFVQIVEGYIVDKSVHDDDIDDTNIKTETIRQKIRDEFIADATVTVVLIGPRTWQRKHVDWEIGSSLRATKKNSRCGLLGILLPNHQDCGTGQHHRRLIPPRLWDNCSKDDPYALIYSWSYDSSQIRRWIHSAFERRKGTPPSNARPQFKYNKTGDCSEGWKG